MCGVFILYKPILKLLKLFISIWSSHVITQQTWYCIEISVMDFFIDYSPILKRDGRFLVEPRDDNIDIGIWTYGMIQTSWLIGAGWLVMVDLWWTLKRHCHLLLVAPDHFDKFRCSQWRHFCRNDISHKFALAVVWWSCTMYVFLV